MEEDISIFILFQAAEYIKVGEEVCIYDQLIIIKQVSINA